MNSKVIEIDAAIDMVRTGHTVAVGGSGSLLQVPDGLLAALARRYHAAKEPRGLTIVHSMGLGDNADRGLERLADSGLVRRLIGSHYGHNPKLGAMIGAGEVEAFALPAGAVTLLYREIAGGRPGLITSVGLGTYVDPRVEGGRMNHVTEGSVVEVIEVAGSEWLFYPSFPLDIALLRATAADTAGNLVMDDEAGFADNLALAEAAHNSGGRVIAEVKYVVASHSLSPRQVKVPGVLVDAVVEEPDQWQTPITRYSPFRAGRYRHPPRRLTPLPLDIRKVIARRAAHELFAGAVVNLGYGVSTGIANVLDEESCTDSVTLTVEQGIIGGVPGSGLDGGTGINADAFIDEGAQFDFYGGGGLDVCFVSFGEVDGAGNVNVSKLAGRAVGPGGFIDITQNARKAVFCGSMTRGGLEVDAHDGSIAISTEGRFRKFVDRVAQITFSGQQSLRVGQQVTIVTERAVFTLQDDGLTLREIAPGIDIERDVLLQCGCNVRVAADVATAPAYIYRPYPMSSEGFTVPPHPTARTLAASAGARQRHD